MEEMVDKRVQVKVQSTTEKMVDVEMEEVEVPITHPMAVQIFMLVWVVKGGNGYMKVIFTSTPIIFNC